MAKLEKDPDTGALAAVDFAEFTDQQVTPSFPLIEGATVVYLGSSRHKSVALTGRVYIEAIETGEHEANGDVKYHVTKTASGEGIQAYDFATHDNQGRIIRSRMTKNAANIPEQARNKPCAPCEHPEHLRQFLRMRNQAREREFTILVPTSKQDLFSHYVRRTEQSLGMRDSQLSETVAR